MRAGHRSTCALVVALLVGVATSARASDPDEPAISTPQTPDFLFGQPRLSVSVRAAWLVPREGGDLFAFVRDELTIDPGDFRTVALGADVGAVLNPRLTILGGFDISRAQVASEYRHFIGSDGLPIAQETGLVVASLAGSLKVALLPAGSRISRYAWIPRTITPFVGAGGGLTYYNFKQDGEFVDFEDQSIFPSHFRSAGWGPIAQVFGGADLRAWRNVAITIQARYAWSHAKLGPDFVDFDGIDLTGLRIESGVTLQF